MLNPLDLNSLADALEAQVASLRSKRTAHLDFVKQIVKLGQQAQSLLRKEEAQQPISEMQREQAQRDWGVFSTTQAVVDFCQKHKLTLDKHTCWWMMAKQPWGTIQGLEAPANATGFARITNGIDIWIERADGTLFKGHRDWFKAHKVEKASKAQEKEQESTKLEEEMAEKYGFLLK